MDSTPAEVIKAIDVLCERSRDNDNFVGAYFNGIGITVCLVEQSPEGAYMPEFMGVRLAYEITGVFEPE